MAFAKNSSPFAIRPLSVLFVLSATLVYCGQTVGWIEVQLGAEVDLSPGDIVLDGDLPSSPAERGTAAPTSRPMFISVHVYCGQINGHPSQQLLNSCYNDAAIYRLDVIILNSRSN